VLTITVPQIESFDEENNIFLKSGPDTRLQLEHSLASLSKWEATWEIPFLSDVDKTDEQTIDYIRCMTLTEDVDPEVYGRLSTENLNDVNKYIGSKQTATWFSEKLAPGKVAKKEVITAEIVYWMMVSLRIPLEAEEWHLNKLVTLIRVCNEKNNPEKKPQMSQAEMLAQRNALNEKRKAEMGTRG
jgi:hypothetical protein